MKQWIKSMLAAGTAILLLLSAAHPYSYGAGGSGPEAGNHALIRVGLQYTQAALDRCTITGTQELSLWNPEKGDEFIPLAGTSEVLVSIEGGSLKVVDSAGGEIQVQTENQVAEVTDLLEQGYLFCSSNYSSRLADPSTGILSVIRVNGTPYRGSMGFFINANNTFRLVNTLTIDEYAYGVINSEMGYSNPMEALKAQAVVVRSYALTNIGRHGTSGYDVCDSTHCQVYKGYNQENTRSNQAVDETSMLGMYYMGEPATGYFYKNSGGYTQKAEDVWNAPVGYLKAVQDPYSPLYSWTAEFTFSELETKLRTAGYRTGPLTSVTVTGHNESGAVATLTLKGQEGTVTLTKEKIRSVLGMTQIKSTHFSLTSGQAQATQAWYVLGKGQKSQAGSKIHVLGASGAKAQLEIADKYVIGSSGVQKLEGYTQEITGNNLRFEGKGYGHGVGMPQDSAIAMAKEGAGFEEILKYYYKDIEIK